MKKQHDGPGKKPIRDLMKKVYRKKAWNRTVTSIAGIIVFVTTYMLILPAITMTKNPVCGLEAHVHDDNCYTMNYSRVLACPYEAMARDGVIVLHHHDENCYDEGGNLICTLPEIEAHRHTDQCYTPTVKADDLFLAGAGETGILTGESNVGAPSGTLSVSEDVFTAGNEEAAEKQAGLQAAGAASAGDESQDLFQAGDEAAPSADVSRQQVSLNPTDVFVQDSRDQADVFVQDSRDQADVFVQGSPGTEAENTSVVTMPGETKVQEGEPVLIPQENQKADPLCGKAEIILHSHSQECYDFFGNLICGKPEVVEHQHTDACFTLQESGLTLTCTLPEHTHTDDCYKQSVLDLLTQQGDKAGEDVALLFDENSDSRLLAESDLFTGGSVPVLEDGASLLKEETPLLDDGAPLLDKEETPLLENGDPLLEKEETPLLDDGTPLLDKEEIPLLEDGAPLFDKEEIPPLDENPVLNEGVSNEGVSSEDFSNEDYLNQGSSNEDLLNADSLNETISKEDISVQTTEKDELPGENGDISAEAGQAQPQGVSFVIEPGIIIPEPGKENGDAIVVLPGGQEDKASEENPETEGTWNEGIPNQIEVMPETDESVSEEADTDPLVVVDAGSEAETVQEAEAGAEAEADQEETGADVEADQEEIAGVEAEAGADAEVDQEKAGVETEADHRTEDVDDSKSITEIVEDDLTKDTVENGVESITEINVETVTVSEEETNDGTVKDREEASEQTTESVMDTGNKSEGEALSEIIKEDNSEYFSEAKEESITASLIETVDEMMTESSAKVEAGTAKADIGADIDIEASEQTDDGTVEIATVVDTASEKMTEADSIPVTERETDPDVEMMTEQVTETASEDDPETLRESISEAETEATSEAGIESATESVTELRTESVSVQAAEAVTETMSEVISEQITEAVTEAMSEAISEQITEAVTETMTEVTSEQAVEALTEITTETVSEQITEAVTEMTTEAVSEQTTEAVTEMTTEAVTEMTTEAVSEQTTEAVTEITTETVSEQTTEAVTEMTTEMVTEPTTEQETENTTEGTTEIMTSGEDEKNTPSVKEYRGSDYLVRVTYDKKAGIPEDAYVDAQEIAHDSEEYQQYLSQAKSALGLPEDKELPKEFARFFDIRILVENEDGEEEIEPEGSVRVEILYDEPVNLTGADKAEASVVHFDEKEDDVKVLATMEVATGQSGTEVTEDSETEETEHSKPSELTETSDLLVEKEDQASDGDEEKEAQTDEGSERSELEKVGAGEQSVDIFVAGEEDAVQDSGTAGIEFSTDSFSVYGVIYTVDFHWEVDGKVYTFSMPGDGSVSFSALVEVLGIAKNALQKDYKNDNTKDDLEDTREGDIGESEVIDILIPDDIQISEETKKFVADVESVTFSNPELVFVAYTEEAATLGEIKAANGIYQKPDTWMNQDNLIRFNSKEFNAGDWALISLLPFQTDEYLTIFLNNGDTLEIKVTDEQNAVMNDNGTVQTILNPGGTTITMFDYWMYNGRDSGSGDGWYFSNNIDQNTTGRAAWPGGYHLTNTSTGYDWYVQTSMSNNGGFPFLIGTGNNSGINYGHNFKFRPASWHNVIDGTLGTLEENNKHRINSWTGSADPTQGLFLDRLYDEAGNPTISGVYGYPKLTTDTDLGTDGESLAYLFNTENTENSNYKASYSANHLLYVDPDGYYTYDSWDYKAAFNKNTGTFTLTEQDPNETSTEKRSFWPFGDQNYWLGMHINTEFSMPYGTESNPKQVLNPKGEYLDMVFEFGGDDDALVYIDGVLVGDGGGVHNKTKIFIDFTTGAVLVTGKEDPDPERVGTFEQTTTIKAMFENAGVASNYEWDGNTFKAGTYHNFDFYYLERGGGESNLYLHYNLVSTADFTGHKSLLGLEDDERLYKDEFQFELIGLGNDVIMPLESFGHQTTGSMQLSNGTTISTKTYTVGVNDEGNVNFGTLEAPENPPPDLKCHYIIREIPKEQTQQLTNVNYDNIDFDSKVYYMEAVVDYWEDAQNTRHAYLKKTYYEDDTFTTPIEDKFISFVNIYLDPLTLIINKKNEDDLSMQGVQFKLTKSIFDENLQKWIPVSGLVPVVLSTNEEGKIEFDSLSLGNYVLEEVQGLPGYKDAEYKWLVCLTRQERQVTKDGKIVTEYYLQPAIKKINLDGSEIANETAVQCEVVNDSFEYEVLNTPKEIQLSVEKKWPGGIPSGATPTFQLKRNVTYEEQDEPQKVYVYIRYANNYLSYEKGGCNTNYWREVPINSTVKFGFSDYNDCWLSIYLDGSGPSHSGVTFSNHRYETDYNVGTKEVCFWLYANHTNVYPTDSQFNFKLEYVDGTGTIPTTTHSVTKEDTAFTNENHSFTFPAGTTSWTHTFDPFPIAGTYEGKPATYAYYIEEVGTVNGYEPVYVDSNGNIVSKTDLSSLAQNTSGTQTIYNIKEVDVPVDKGWPDFATEDYTWNATFVLEEREIRENGEIASDEHLNWTPVNPAKEITIQKGATGDAVTFKDLPMYRVHNNGSVYRILYAVEEIAYEVKQGNNVVAKWTKAGGLENGENRYAPSFIQDAGEMDNLEGTDEWYKIKLSNVVSNETVVDLTNISIEKKWPVGTTLPNNAYATFKLRRYVHEEYRDYKKESNVNVNNMVTLTLKMDDDHQSILHVPTGVQVWIEGIVKAGEHANVAFTRSNNSVIYLQYNNAEGDSNVLQSTSKFVALTNETITVTSGYDSLQSGKYGARLVYYTTENDRTTDKIDDTWSEEFTLNEHHNWAKYWANLPRTIEGDIHDYKQTVHVYSYFFEEVESNPEDYYAVFKDPATGKMFGDEAGIIDAAYQAVKADNLEIPIRVLKKVDISDIDKDNIGAEDLLSGAQFKIVKYKSFSPLEKDISWKENGERVVNVDSTQDGLFTCSGLKPGLYMIEETAYPTGYIQSTEYPRFEVKVNRTTFQLEIVMLNSDGTVAQNNHTETVRIDNDDFIVGNIPGAALPSTGGPGTTIFYLFGALLTTCAGAGIMMKRKQMIN